MYSRCTHDYRESFVINKKYHTVRTVPKSNGNIVEIEAKSTPLTHLYMTTHSPGLVQTLQ
jgi:hypothetical protein